MPDSSTGATVVDPLILVCSSGGCADTDVGGITNGPLKPHALTHALATPSTAAIFITARKVKARFIYNPSVDLIMESAIMTETEYLQQAKRLFDAILSHIEDTHDDLETQAHGAVLEIENDDGQKVIINQQAAMQEVWLASRAGGYHFKFDNDAWVNTRDGRDFWDYLAEALTGLA